MIHRTRNKVFRRFKNMRRGYRMMGWFFIALGGFMFLMTLRLYLDPAGEIVYNGLATTSPELKVRAVTFTALFPLVGLVFALLPNRVYRRLFRSQLRFCPFLAGSTTGGVSLGIYRFLDRHPVYAGLGFVVFFSFVAVPGFFGELERGRPVGELVPSYLFMYVFFSVFFVYGFKFMYWVMLRSQGMSTLRMKGGD